MTERSLLALAILGVVGLTGCGESTTNEGAGPSREFVRLRGASIVRSLARARWQ